MKYKNTNGRKITGSAGTISAIMIAILPAIGCPACWPAYAGVLSSLGVGFFDYSPYVLPLLIAALLFSLSMLLYRSRRRHGIYPFFPGLAGAVLLLLSKTVPTVSYLLIPGATLLVTASVWNAWPLKKGNNEPSCPSCESFEAKETT